MGIITGDHEKKKKKMMMRVKESTMVRPAKATPRQKLWNSNLDLVVGRIHLLTVYFYRPPPNINVMSSSSNNFFDARVLKEALSNVLVSFYPMAGRLRLDEAEEDGSRRLVIDCNAEGVLFVEAETDYTLDDFGHFTPSPEQRRLAPTVDYSAHISSYPLFIAQVTYFKCGGVSLGCGTHHTLSDGISSLHFINTWSDIARGLPVAIPPFIDRTFLRARDPPRPIFDHIEYHAPPPMNKPLVKTTKIVVSTAILKLTLDQLNELKRKAKSDRDTKDLSSYAILAAHLWRCVCKARGLCDDQVTKLYIATDGRLRLSPMVPPGYLGNVVFTAAHVAKSGDIISEPLTISAKKIHKEVAKMDNEYLRSALDYLESRADLSVLVRGPNYFTCPNLNINSWIRLPIYDADFGWGRPIFMGPASILYEGTIYVIPSPNEDGSVSLALCLDADHMPLFEKYFYDF